MTDPERLKAFDELFKKERPMEKWTVQKFIELLHRHAVQDLGGTVLAGPAYQVLIDGHYNFESLVEELNKELQ